MLGEALGDLLSDFKRSSPDLVTNIRTLGGGRNREIIAQIQAGRERIAILVKIMSNFTFVKTSLVEPLQSRGPAEPEIPLPVALPEEARGQGRGPRGAWRRSLILGRENLRADVWPIPGSVEPHARGERVGRVPRGLPALAQPDGSEAPPASGPRSAIVSPRGGGVEEKPAPPAFGQLRRQPLGYGPG